MLSVIVNHGFLIADTVIPNQNFDTWGILRNPTHWTFVNVPAPTSYLYLDFWSWAFDKFQSDQHERNAVGGRMYDPVVERVLSVDNYVK
ncbi:hypothetical protein [Dyadobacter sp. CY323]|uniref:hypothetical protein n=1 Tax=Dyadobacter sp. CY323 TaxID=2907302 RepID=UPI001F412C4E|nr:hypothetical protein [Dyadobacter sp. CY323]MCE6988170.1 hypothetical protein [Dyadobacter sp. CY323]